VGGLIWLQITLQKWRFVSLSPHSLWSFVAFGAGRRGIGSKSRTESIPPWIGKGVVQMTTLSRLLAEKQRLMEQLQEDIGPEERDEIERLLEKIDAALDSLDKAGPGGTSAGD
jgi:hypothetical protein